MNIEGDKYRTVDNWFDFVPEPDGPINYLEIGAYYGANVISYAQSRYGKNPASEIHCIDPWLDYDDYDEYKGHQETIYETFRRNLVTNQLEDRIQVHRGFSADLIPTFADEFFDIIYIDGNHEPQYILEDAVLAFRRLKPNGYLIFDDYGWRDASIGIDAFLQAYSKSYRLIMPNHNTQVFIQKLDIKL
jgi:hypothetical protein